MVNKTYVLLVVSVVFSRALEAVHHVSLLYDYHVEYFCESVYCIYDTRLLDNGYGFSYEPLAIFFV